VGVSTGLRKTALDPLRHEVVVVVGIAAFAVDLLGTSVLADDFQMDRTHAQAACLLFHEG
jgi:hypothetical protein